MIEPVDASDWLALTEEPLDYARALEWVGGERWGAVVGFSGLVRENAEERTGVTSIDYEAYSEQVVPRLAALAEAARQCWSDIGRIVMWHRVGRVATAEPSVVIAVSTPHRAEAFESCRFLIDQLKATVPIWKREHWPGGSAWSPAARPIGSVGDRSEGRGS